MPNILPFLLVAIFIGVLVFVKLKYVLKLKRKDNISSLIHTFWFQRKNLNFLPGQFLEWTLYHKKPDDRGIKRYFTIASSPTEKDLLLTTKIIPKSSSYKKALKNLKVGKRIIISKPQGDFVLPENDKQKLIFIAGGIGITPFRSIIKYLIDKNLKRDIILFYNANSVEEFSFKDILENLGIKIIYIISDNPPKNWKGETGYLNEKIIKKHAPDWKERLFYVSGPEPMVNTTNNILIKMSVPRKQIKNDYFPGYSEI